MFAVMEKKLYLKLDSYTRKHCQDCCALANTLCATGDPWLTNCWYFVNTHEIKFLCVALTLLIKLYLLVFFVTIFLRKVSDLLHMQLDINRECMKLVIYSTRHNRMDTYAHFCIWHGLRVNSNFDVDLFSF